MNGWQAFGFKSYQEYLNHWMWQEKRKLFLEKYPYCKNCGYFASNVHHLTYERVPQEKERDLISLCVQCHKKEHKI
jgi:5-methylcytosine-specific restriction endonuclease McrA